MTDNELLLAISNIVQSQIEPVKTDIQDLRLSLQDTRLFLENDMLPRLQNIEACYTSTYKRYQTGVNQMDSMQSDISIMKKVISEHSEKLQKLTAAG